jgi:hypothetical protein
MGPSKGRARPRDSRPPDPIDAETAGSSPSVASPGWFDAETSLGTASWTTLARLARRARVSSPLWLAAALIVSAALTLWRARVPPSYDVTVVLRVSDGGVQSTGANLGAGALRAHVNDLAFTSARLLELTHRFPKVFRDVDKDPEAAVTGIREQLTIAITENDFIEERAPSDPPRTARITLAYRSSDPEIAWTIAHELGNLLAGSTLASQRAVLQAEEAAAAAALRRASADMSALAARSLPHGDPRLSAARDRREDAEETLAEARIASRAAEEHQTLRFDVVDPGRVPARIDKARSAVTTMVSTFLIAAMIAWLLAGAFDPRILDGEDLSGLGISLLGPVPALPPRRRQGRAAGPRV